MPQSGRENITSGSLRRRLNDFRDFFLSLSVLTLGTLWIIGAEHFPILPACPFKALTGIPCPGCGGVRAITALFHGHFLEALYTNPLSLIVFLFLCIVPIWTLIDGFRQQPTLRRILTTRWNTSATIILVLILLANWTWNIVKQL